MLKIKYINSHNNLYFFTAALVLLLLSSAIVGSMSESVFGHRILQAIIIFVEVVAYFSLNLSASWRRFVVLMVVLAVTANVLRELSDWSAAPIAGLLANLLFFLGITYIVARQVLFNGSIEWNTIIGTVAVYLLLGLVWALLYLITLEFWHTGFNGIEYKDWNDNFSAMSYFSFVTMTTLGYGDISPAVPITRTLVYLQAICGTFYMAIVVASMVSSRGTKSH